MASVTLKGVYKSFGTTRVVHGVDIVIADGEFCVLVGPSGCGKSTLLRMIAGLEEISGGALGEGAALATAMIPFLLAAILFSYFGLQRRAWQQGGGDK